MSKLAPLNLNRLERIGRRWASVVFCAMLAAAICLLVDPAVRIISSPLVERLASLPPKLLAILLTAFTTAGVFSAARGRLHGFLGLRRLYVYPPLWMSIVLGLAAWGCTGSWFWGSEWLNSVGGPFRWFVGETWPIICCGAVLLLLTLLAVEPRPDRSVARSSPPTGVATIGKDFLALCEWIRNDDEIRLPGQDRFNHDQVARRIAERLKQPPGEAQTTAVIGPLGSGKSTIGRLVEHHLRSEPGILFASISLWPFESAEAAVRGILQAVTNELGKRVNVLPLVGLPENYVGAVESAAGSLGWIARFLRGSSDPAGVLEGLSTIACAAGLRIVLWVEDLERFSGGDDGPEGPHRAREVERLQPIRSLLYLLDRTDCISVVVADTSLRSRFDLSKTARFIEKPPELTRELVISCVGSLRDNCLRGYPRPTIDPTAPEEREKFKGRSRPNEITEWIIALGGSNRSTSDSLCEIMRSPRAVKMSLRLTLETWEKLAGEIDFDCVLVASALRVVRPDVFALLEKHELLMKHGLHRQESSGAGGKKPHPFVEDINQVLSQDRGLERHLKALVHFLFPAYPPAQGKAEELTSTKVHTRPQAFFGQRQTDYWRRYLAPEPISEHDSDQAALQAIANWRSDASARLMDWMLEPARAERIESFDLQFRAEDLCRLLKETVEDLRNESTADWDRRYMAPAVVSIWSMMVRNRPSQELLAVALESVMPSTVGSSLPLAFCTLYFFVSHDPQNIQLVSTEYRETSKQGFRTALLESFGGPSGPDRFVHAMREGSPWLVSWITGELSDGQEAETGRPFEEWPGVADTLLRTAERWPDYGVPLIVPLFTRSEPDVMTMEDSDRASGFWRAACDWGRATRLFDQERLARVLRGFQVPDEMEGQLRVQVLEAKRAAEKLIGQED